MNIEEKRRLTATILAGLLANPAVIQPNPNSGWRLVNCTEDDIVGYADHLASKIIGEPAQNDKLTQPRHE